MKPNTKDSTKPGGDPLAGVVSMVRDQSETLRQIAEKQKRIDELDANVKRIEEAVRRSAISLPGTEGMVESGQYSFARLCRAVHRDRPQDAPFEIDIANESMKRLSGENQNRVMSTLTDSAGGYLVPEEVHAALIPKLDAASFLDKVGVTQIAPRGYPYRVAKVTSGATAYMVGEGSRATASDLALGMVNLMPKKCAARVILTNEQVMWGTPASDQIVMNDLAVRIALKQDQQVLHGKGTDNEILGIMPAGATAAPSGYTTVAGGTTVPLFGDFNKAMGALAEVNVDIGNLGAAMHPRVMFKLFRQLVMDVATQTEALGAGFLAGFPLASAARFKELTGISIAPTTQMSVAMNTDDTWVAIGDWSGYFFARFGGLVIAKSDVASDGTYHGFTDDIMHVKAVTWFDGAAIRQADICIITGYDYAACAA